MTIRRNLMCLAALAALTSVSVASADVMVWFDSASPTVNVGETVAVDIMASFETPVVGWGIDMAIGEPTYADWVGTAIGLDWNASDTLDHDGLAGLRFDTGLTGDVLLATVTFEGLAAGQTLLTLSGGDDEDEGFLLEAGGLATNVQFSPATLTVIPEPGGLALLAFGTVATLLRRR